MIRVAESTCVGGGARGVFAERDIAKGQTLEVAPVIVVPRTQSYVIRESRLNDYTFEWGGGCLAVALGYGSLYNHAYEPNARYWQDTENRTLEFVALRRIQRGEEITINYNSDPESAEDLWFPVKAI